MMHQSKPSNHYSKDNFPVLLVEDNKHEVLFVRRAFEVNKITNPLYVVSNGQQCIDFLCHKGEYVDAFQYPRPGIILMDINMPIMNGLEALSIIKSDETFKTIPVIMLTSSAEEEARVKSYEYGCNTLIQKPVDFEKFAAAVRSIHIYWTLSELL